MVEARDEFETTDVAFEDDFEDAEGSEDLGFDTEEALAQVDQSETDASEQLRGLVEWIVFQLVDDTSQVSVTADQRGSSVRVQVRLPEEDLGKVIGRGGRIAKSIRSVLMIVGSRDHLRVSLDIEGQS
jgi:predicted RNA-binding protein YlqC (UPF0109 family)